MFTKSLKKVCVHMECMRCCYNSACCSAVKPCFLNEIYVEQLQILRKL